MCKESMAFLATTINRQHNTSMILLRSTDFLKALNLQDQFDQPVPSAGVEFIPGRRIIETKAVGD